VATSGAEIVPVVTGNVNDHWSAPLGEYAWLARCIVPSSGLTMIDSQKTAASAVDRHEFILGFDFTLDVAIHVTYAALSSTTTGTRRSGYSLVSACFQARGRRTR